MFIDLFSFGFLYWEGEKTRKTLLIPFYNSYDYIIDRIWVKIIGPSFNTELNVCVLLGE